MDGRDIYLRKHGTPSRPAEYDRLVSEWLAQGRRAASVATIPDGISINEMLVSYWGHVERHYRDAEGATTDEVGNIETAVRPLRRLYSMTKARDFGPLSPRAIREEMVKAGLARTSINARVNRIRHAFKWATSVNLVPVSVVQTLVTIPGLQRGRTLARESKTVGPVTPDVVEATLSHVSRPVAAMIRLQLLTAMRPGEVCAMRGCDLVHGETIWAYEPANHKTAHRGKSRTIPLNRPPGD